ncbi:MAG: peptide chain release factor N(5)-glutamine methyltransferase [Verrucomicrobia bacterium]|nr:peptide chain release factor N(5)-glutamine methyltransferase [Verrucomicrobiota bacterium]
MTTLEVLNAATSYLDKQGVESPRLNAEYLLAHVLGKKKRIELYLEFERPLGEKERAPLRDLVKRRSEGIPLQHLLGTAEFCGHLFTCDARGLIPRPETEQLVELILKSSPDAASILDVGTGSGVIAISLALALPASKVSACDLSPSALSLAQENAARHQLEARMTFFQSDLLAAVSETFAVIAANLPYIPSADIPNLSREVQKDPLTALDGGPDGLVLVERLIAEAPSRLSPGGLLALEIGHDQAERTMALLADNNYRDIAAHRDYQDVQRFVSARHG